MAPLMRGSHANLVYVSNQGSADNPTSSILKRYDITSKSETTILALPHTPIMEAQVSADGNWVLFRASVENRSAIQLIRMDGQGLQTLYCSAKGVQFGASSLEWSPDKKYVAFLEDGNVYLLTIAGGTYRVALSRTTTVSYAPRTWLDNTRLYLFGALPGTETPPLYNISLLDITTAEVQQVLNEPALCGDFDSSIDGTHLFMSECVASMPSKGGPSSIKVLPATGGTGTTIYSMPTYGITTLRVASADTLLFVIDNTGVGSVDTSHNGLWKMNTDGTGLTRLTTEPADETTLFNIYTQYFWSTVSRDGMWYAVQAVNYASSSARSAWILVGPINGDTPFTLATGPMRIVGWTTM
jgi:Tol biopolymer transport system component